MRYMRSIRGGILFGGLFIAQLVLIGCSVPPKVLVVATSTPARVPTFDSLTETPGAAGAPSTPVACAYVWASKDLPELSQQLSQVIHAAKISNVDARAGAYGENCIDTNTNRVVSFSVMQTDFYLTTPLQDTQDTQAMGDWIANIIPIIGQIPASELSGPNPGNISIQFKSTAGDISLTFPRKVAEDLLRKGIRGSALYQALSNAAPPQ